MIENFPLAAEYEYYLSRKPELLQACKGLFALIKGHELAGVFDTEEAAYTEGTQRYGGDPFLIVRVQDGEPQVSFHVRGEARGRRPPAKRGRLEDESIVEVDMPLPP